MVKKHKNVWGTMHKKVLNSYNYIMVKKKKNISRIKK